MTQYKMVNGPCTVAGITGYYGVEIPVGTISVGYDGEYVNGGSGHVNVKRFTGSNAIGNAERFIAEQKRRFPDTDAD